MIPTQRSARGGALRSLALSALVVLAACAPATMQETPATPRPGAASLAAPATGAAAATAVRGASVEGITEYTLPNGLRVLLFPDPTKPTVTVNVTYFVGSRHESYGETGMAHLLEHLLFKGTPNHPNIPQELTERGARPNGTTWFDRTNYFETFPASDDNLEWALRMEADRMVNSFVRQEDLDSEMTVVRNEFEMGENFPFNVLMKRTLGAAFQWHSYGRSTIGERSDIENVSIERLRAFYRKYYQPDNAMLVVAGQFDEARALELIGQTFGRLPRPERTLPETYTQEPTQDGERSVTLRRVGDVQVLQSVYKVPAGSHEDFAGIAILRHVLGDTPAGRLHKALVEPRKAAATGGFAFQLREPGALIFYAEVRKEDSLEEARDIFVRTIEDAARVPPTAEEVERARTALLRDIELAMNNSERIALGLSEWGAMGDWRLFFLNRDRLRSVTPADVQRVAAHYLKPDNRTLGTFIPTERPERAIIPATPDVAALVRDYQGDAAVAAGEAFDPSPENIESRLARSTLPSGFQLALLPKKTRGETVSAYLILRHGSEQTLMNRGAAPSMAGGMLMRGTKSKTRQQVRDEIDRLKARVNVGGGTTNAFASIETTRENLPAVLELVGEMLREPAFDEREFEILRAERLAMLEEQRSEPNSLGSTAFERHLNPRAAGHPSYVRTIDEQIAELKAVTLADAKRFYEEFYGASAGQMAVVGDFDAEQIAAVSARLFGEWRSPQPFERIASPYREVPATVISIETPDKANAFFMAGLPLEVRDDDPDYAALVLGNYMLGGGFLNSRLATRLRQRDGLSYGVGSSLSSNPLDRSGRFMTFAIYAPENVAKLERAFREEIERALHEGFTAEEVAAAKSGYLQSQQVNRAQDMGLARSLASWLYFERTLEYDAELERRIAALTPEQIVETLRRHLDPSKLTIVKAGDFANKPPLAPEE